MPEDRATHRHAPDTPRVSPLLAQIPNVLTVSRLVLAGAFFLALELARRPIHDEAWLLSAAAIFVVGATTDALDGFLARRWNVISVFGRVMDPVADKVLVLGAFVYLAGPAFLTTVQSPGGEVRPVQATAVDAWMVVVMLWRELVVTSLRAVLEARGVDFSASLTGKLKMISQSVAVPAVMALVALGSNLTGADPYSLPRPPMPDWINWTIRGVVWSTVLLTFLSAIPYLVRGATLMRQSSKDVANGGGR